MNHAMEPPTKVEVEDFDSRSPTHSLTPQRSAKSPTPRATARSARSTAASTHRSKKSTLSKQEQGELYVQKYNKFKKHICNYVTIHVVTMELL